MKQYVKSTHRFAKNYPMIDIPIRIFTILSLMIWAFFIEGRGSLIVYVLMWIFYSFQILYRYKSTQLCALFVFAFVGFWLLWIWLPCLAWLVCVINYIEYTKQEYEREMAEYKERKRIEEENRRKHGIRNIDKRNDSDSSDDESKDNNRGRDRLRLDEDFKNRLGHMNYK